MRYQFYLCRDEIWWNNETENKPNGETIMNLNFELSTKQIRYTSQTTAELVADDMSIQYVKCVDTLNKIEDRYYYVNSYDKETATTIKYSLVLDIWVTYAIPMIVKMIDTNMSISIIRSHVKQKNSFQYEDSLLNAIPISYSEREMLKKEFKYIEFNNRIEYDLGAQDTSYRRIINLDKKYIYGGNVAYVFSGGIDNTNDEYVFIPVVATPPIFPDVNIGYFGDYKKTLGTPYGVVSFAKNADIPQAQLNYDRYFNMHAEKVISVNYDDIPNYTKPSDFNITITYNQYYNSYSGTTPIMYVSYSEITQKIYINDVLIKTFTKKNSTQLSSTIPPYPPYPELNQVSFTFQAYTGQSTETFTTIKNDTAKILELVKKPELIKRFVGVYFIPSIINFYRYLKAATSGNFQNYLYFTSKADGLYLDAFSLSTPPISDKKDTYDSAIPNNDVLLKYYNISYYGNNKQWNYWLINNEITFIGLFLFSGCSNIICNLANHKCKDSIITFPYQLPSSSDGYISYYAGIMSNINNGIKQQEISYNMQLAQQSSNVLSSIFGINKNSSFSGLYSSVSSAVFGFANIERQNQAFYSGLKAQFEDVERTSTANFAPSNINDASYISKYMNKGPFAEYLELWKPDDSTLKLLNNVLYMYGNVYPNTYKMRELFQRLYFNYFQVDTKWLQQWVPSLVSSTQNIKSSLINMFSSGVRVWRTKPSMTYEN